jgi:protein phosphatase methylesterase 1
VQSRPVSFKNLPSVVKYGISSGQVRDKRSARVSMPSQVVPVTAADGITRYVWRTDLMATKPYWVEWFTGLTEDFLESSTKKLLFLAGSERMDKELSIAQMQGKFALRVIGDCGHVIQEDQPRRVAEAVRHWRDSVKIRVKIEEQMFIISASG